jgi:hypothetical protein
VVVVVVVVVVGRRRTILGWRATINKHIFHDELSANDGFVRIGYSAAELATPDGRHDGTTPDIRHRELATSTGNWTTRHTPVWPMLFPFECSVP